jgi:hypothetical protein
MQKHEEADFVQVMVTMGEIFPPQLNSVKLKLYWEILKNYSLPMVKSAANLMMKQRKDKFFPLPAEFPDYMETRYPLVVPPVPGAERQLMESDTLDPILKDIRQYFPYVSWAWMDQLAEETKQSNYVIYYLVGDAWSDIHYGRKPEPETGSLDELRELVEQKLQQPCGDARRIAKVCESWGVRVKTWA